MNRERVLRWVEALESGRYQQTSGVLRQGDCFCALGVGCNVSGVGKWGGGLNGRISYYQSGTEQVVAVLPRDVVSHYDMRYDIPERVAHMNDDGRSFADIAAYLRRQLALQEALQ